MKKKWRKFWKSRSTCLKIYWQMPTSGRVKFYIPGSELKCPCGCVVNASEWIMKVCGSDPTRWNSSVGWWCIIVQSLSLSPLHHNYYHLLCHLLVILKVIFANSVDPDQEQSDLGPHCLPVCKNRFEKFARIFSRWHKQMTFSDAVFLGALRVK